jgi:Holliday junction resolvasome RuvABC endonuclease subunit
VIAIDPGLRHCGVACFKDGKLAGASLVLSPCTEERGPVAWRAMADAVHTFYPCRGHVLVIEGQKVYPGALAVGDPADLLELAGVCGAIVQTDLVNVHRYFPYEWKGQVPKAKKGGKYIIEERVRRVLDIGEMPKVPWAMPDSKRHNVIDAIGIGLKMLGRFG